MSDSVTRDLAIGRRLADGTATCADVIAIGDLRMERRAPYIGAVFRRIADPDPEMRNAALTALRGVRGVPGVRALRAALDDIATRDAARLALQRTALDAPWRWTHVLFHPDPAVRRAAIPETPNGAQDMLAYLRADPACADLVAFTRWPKLELAFDLHAHEHITDDELCRTIGSTGSTELRSFFEGEHGRMDSEIEAYLEQAETGVPGEITGIDVIDQAFAAIAAAGVDIAEQIRDPQHTARWALRALETVIEAVVTKKPSALTRRAAASLLSLIATKPSPTLIGVCCALEPRVVGSAIFDRSHVAGAASGLIRFKWPVKVAGQQVARLILTPHAKTDLALAAALAGLFAGQRLKQLAKVLGEKAILDSLRTSEHGWNEILQLPQETPALELAWLARIESESPERYLALVAIGLYALHGKRLEHFIDQIPRRYRERAFMTFVQRPELRVDDLRIAAVCRTFASRLDRAAVTSTFTALLGDPSDRGPQIALVLGRALEAKLLASVGRALADEPAVRLVGLLDGEDPLPRDRELAIAAAFAERSHPVLAEWGRRITTLPAVAVVVQAPAIRARRALDDSEKARIATCADSSLELALEPALTSVVTDLCEALEKRAISINAHACAALIGCADPMATVATELERFCEYSRKFDNELDALLGRLFHKVEGDGSPYLHARMFRWETHNFGLARWLERFRTTIEALALIESLPARFAAITMWAGIAEVIVFLRYRDPERFKKLTGEALAMFCAERIDKDIGVSAARILVALVEAQVVHATAVKDAILDRAADANEMTREFLVRIARLEGMPPPPKAEPAGPPPRDLMAEIHACKDIDKLARYCELPRRPVVQEAVLQLLLLGESGQLALADLVSRIASLPAPVPILESIGLWESEAALARARALVENATLPPEWQFHLCMGLIARGDDLIERAFAAANVPATAWFRRGDWEKLVELAGEDRCAIALASSPHHHAYTPAVRALLESWDVLPPIGDALARFLDADAERPITLRRDVARKLIKDYCNFIGLPIYVDELCDEKADEGIKFLDTFRQSALALGTLSLIDVMRMVVDAALIGGDTACSERRMWHIIGNVASLMSHGSMAPFYGRILEEASTSFARKSAAPYVVTEIDANARMRSVAEVFAWGVRRGVELAGRVYRIHMTSDEKDFGHTYLDQTKLYVSPLALLRGEMHGRDIVEGLVLHELGHHVYHASKEAREIWSQAHREGLGRLLNLVADEHLERNLRAIDPTYGDRLKRLGAYAFQHAAQEIDVLVLLSSLRASAAPALIATPLDVAFDERCVKVRRGAMLGELDRVGHPLARFTRALRLGLGNRHNDPRIAAALAMFGKELRKLDMAGLYELTKKLAAMFGGAVAVSRVFGGSEDLGDGGERERDVFAAGVDDSILQREVERILEPKKGRSKGPLGRRDRLQLNVNPDEHFETISAVERVRGVAEAHNRIANVVARHSTRLRAHLDDLGLRWERANARIQGHSLDRSRLKALVTRGDPKILIARTPVRRTDLFLGTLIDCSSSMTAGDNIERARQFGVLITEAVRPLPGVEARFFGFTDSTIYDCGDAKDCGVTGLRADGGNNDAAGLYHAASVAMASQKRAKVLVMISDGLPTSCSVSALKGLVTTLTKRKGIVCAQVAVRKLEEECFPHYVVLDDDQLDVAVARFGRMIADLTRRALSA